MKVWVVFEEEDCSMPAGPFILIGIFDSDRKAEECENELPYYRWTEEWEVE